MFESRYLLPFFLVCTHWLCGFFFLLCELFLTFSKSAWMENHV